MAFLEDTREATADGSDELGAEMGEEVEVFAKFLDECILPRGSTAEQRARIFKLVDHYYGYARETADVMRERARLARLARGSNDSTGSNSSHNGNGNGIGSMGLEVRALQLHDRRDGENGENQVAASSARQWEEEAQTWDLLRRLLPLRYRDRIAAAAAAATAPTPTTTAGRPPQTRREYWADFVLSEPKARERKTVLEWLQSSASSSRRPIEETVQDLQHSAERGEIVAHGWLHTRGAIKQHKRLVAASEPLDPASPDLAQSNLEVPVRLVTQLDPDVVTRQTNRRLAPQDAFFEQAIWLGCYELLRRGRSMAEIRDWCVERTELWRAASVSALPLSSSSDDDSDDSDASGFDCLSMVLWRRMCYRLAQEAASSSQPERRYERAVYGILSGDLASVEAISVSWDDLTFARYNAELRAQFDGYLARQADSSALHALQLLHSDVPVDVTVSASSSAAASAARDREDRVRRAANTPAKALQAAILDEKLDAYLFQQGALLAEHANAIQESKLLPRYDTSAAVVAKAGQQQLQTSEGRRFVDPSDAHCLRILAHVLIVVNALDRLDGRGKDAAALGPLARRHQTEEHVIASFISLLRLGRLEELIPLYASKLLGDRCYTSMAFNLIHLEERDVQLRLLHLMRRLGLDVIKFVQVQPQLFLADVVEGAAGECPARETFRLLQDSPPTLKFGRLLRPGFFGGTSGLPGDDQDDLVIVDRKDELLIRSLEWMMLVDGLVLETCGYGVRIYKYFLTARVLSSRVPCCEIIRQKTRFGQDMSDENDPCWWEELFGTQSTGKAGSNGSAVGDVIDDEMAFSNGVDGVDAIGGEPSKNEVAAHARPLFELECLVNALDCLETTSMLSAMMANTHTDPARDRNVAKNIDENTKFLNGFMRPLLSGWLLHSVDGEHSVSSVSTSLYHLLTLTDDRDSRALRETYLPQVVIGFASTLQFAGTTSSRDYLLECMELAAAVAAPGSDLATVLVQTGRMRELVESFASCSKALAIWTSDLKKGPGAVSKKTREMGWSRELWSVKQ
ncbi:nuclear pore complex protein [Grosmannia clavigera kw1407]|uniref:Nuclear pore complex protein n=1 Tax=Grosmannia clavigera (strain kw1407 / UAMH 11150) TaxID=655863 RepID=F0X9B9_GROCL|nr:nuclear pore complex protein [Grosmannia clavigera kw1407]EFX05864.1 nuclear pore complex protein [Grosmannia clavigera kw1407]